MRGIKSESAELLNELAQHAKAVKQEQKRAAKNNNNPQLEGPGRGMNH
ncbi:MAG: hypothetical protein IKQ91_03790 [Oscillospiraceae bacterium]|nr:hypothetical protein [Oscillospiraceae bacterium]